MRGFHRIPIWVQATSLSLSHCPKAATASSRSWRWYTAAGTATGYLGSGVGLDMPGVSRQTSKGATRLRGLEDDFILSGAEDLKPVERLPGKTRYRTRAEGLFALIYHHRR